MNKFPERFTWHSPFWIATLIGLVGGELTIPAAIIVYLLKLGGVTF